MNHRVIGMSLGVCLVVLLAAGCDGSGESTGVAGGGDLDLDGVADAADNCPVDYNPSQADVDGDGMGELCEPFEPFEGEIDCDFQPCDVSDDCFAQLDDCPGASGELAFTGQAVVCCDHVCAVGSVQSASICPAGTCIDSAPHCAADADCEGGLEGSCFEGCCFTPAEPPVCEFLSCGEAAADFCSPEECSEDPCTLADPSLFCGSDGCCVPSG